MNQYEQYRPFMKTGDVIAFAGRGRVSQIIRWKTKSRFTHVGIVTNASLQGDFAPALLLFESTTLNNIPDIIRGKIVQGVQMHFLSVRIDTFDGEVAWLPLQKPMEEYQKFNMIKWLKEQHKRKVKYDNLGAIGAGSDLFDWIPGIANEPDFSTLFCSEMVAAALQIAGAIDNSLNPSEMTPADILKLKCFEKQVVIRS